MDNPTQLDFDNREFRIASELLERTNQSVFLTGKAGTGKSTFLRHICATTRKKHVVLAPTGIAAVNVRGVTLHSFFQIPFKPLLPDDPEYSPRKIRKTLRFTKEKIKLLKDLELIIIDEISMVRADIMDHIDRILRIYSQNMREPFGGKQMLLVGDVFQLEPVVTSDMRDILRRYYQQFFFFNAHVFNQISLVPIELVKIYRQTDSAFVSMLDRIRINRATKADLQGLNSRYNPNYVDDPTQMSITLAPRRNTVDAINDEHMEALTGEEFIFEGKIEGSFPDQNLPTSQRLVLKVGAQVIFIRNDKEGRWVNGTLGRINNIIGDNVWVELEDGNAYAVEPDIWENVQYGYDEKEKKVTETVLGSFEQLPLKPAWALTVHKSQGLTFNRIVLDFSGGAFAGGQTYVALSRCTSLDGITMLKPLAERDVIVNNSVVEFSRKFNNDRLIDDALQRAECNENYRLAVRAFDLNKFHECMDYLHKAMMVRNDIGLPTAKRLAAVKLSRINALEEKVRSLEHKVATQYRTLENLAMEYVAMANEVVQPHTAEGIVAEPAAGYGNDSMSAVMLKAAIANYDKALNLCPGLKCALIGKARLLANIGETKQAVSLIDVLLTVHNDDYEAEMLLGEIYTKSDDMPQAIKAYKRAVRINKSAIEPHRHLADIYEKIGLDDLAEVHELQIKLLKEKAKKKSLKRKKKKTDE